MRKLDTPTKRAGVVISVIGFILILSSSIMTTYKSTLFGNPYYDSPNTFQTILTWFEKLTNSLVSTVTFKTWSSDFSVLMLFGVSFLIVGILMSYLYDFTIGKIFNWIKTGGR